MCLQVGEIEEDIYYSDVNGVVNRRWGDVSWIVDSRQLIECGRDLGRDLCDGGKSEGHLVH